MPSTASRRRIEVPLDIYAALTRAAADRHLPTAALASLWLQERLAQERPDLRTNPSTYRYRAMHDRRWDATTYYWGPRDEQPAGTQNVAGPPSPDEE